MLSKRSAITILLTVLFVAVLVVAALRAEKKLSNQHAAVFNEKNIKISTLPIPVIDAGHGGEDGGAVSSDGVRESIINLEIAIKLKNIFDFCAIAPVLTRESEEIAYPENALTTRQRKNADLHARAALINNMDNAVLISIHQNKYTDSRPYGAQIFYTDIGDSRIMAEQLQEYMRLVSPKNYRQAAQVSKDIYLMRTVKCPAILVECGFLSNTAEALNLQNNGYQLKLALTMAAGYFAVYNN